MGQAMSSHVPMNILEQPSLEHWSKEVKAQTAWHLFQCVFTLFLQWLLERHHSQIPFVGEEIEVLREFGLFMAMQFPFCGVLIVSQCFSCPELKKKNKMPWTNDLLPFWRNQGWRELYFESCFYFCIKLPKASWGEKVLIGPHFHITVHYWEKSRHELKAETCSHGSKDHGRMLLLVSHDLLGVPFKTQVHLLKGGITHIGLDPLTSIIN